MSTPRFTRLCIAGMQIPAALRNSAISALTWQTAPVDSSSMIRECAGFILCLLRLSAPLHCIVAPNDHAASVAPAGCIQASCGAHRQLCLPIGCSLASTACFISGWACNGKGSLLHNFPVHGCR